MIAVERPAHWKARPGTFDNDMWICINEQNEYGLPAAFDPTDVVIDVGAHIGCFTWAAYSRGAFVQSYECEPGNFALLEANTRDCDRIMVCEAAVWRSDEPVDEVHFLGSADERNTGGGSVCSDVGFPVKAIAFDDVIDLALDESVTGRVRLVKMDCEGSEFPILFTSQKLDLIDELVGEYHLRESWAPHLASARFTLDGLHALLENAGFVFTSTPSSPHLGIFRAVRR